MAGGVILSEKKQQVITHEFRTTKPSVPEDKYCGKCFAVVSMPLSWKLFSFWWLVEQQMAWSYHKYVSPRSTVHWKAAKTQHCWTTQSTEHRVAHTQEWESFPQTVKGLSMVEHPNYHLAVSHHTNTYSNPIFKRLHGKEGSLSCK